jgi:hypothetical protein
MTITEQMTATAEEFIQFWKMILPDVAPPGMDQFLLWVSGNSHQRVLRGISGAARKRRAVLSSTGKAMTTDEVAAYASSILRHEAEGRRRFQ